MSLIGEDKVGIVNIRINSKKTKDERFLSSRLTVYSPSLYYIKYGRTESLVISNLELAAFISNSLLLLLPHRFE